MNKPPSRRKDDNKQGNAARLRSTTDERANQGSSNNVVPVEVIASDELTQDEQKERLRLERVVERSFYEAGKALQQLKERKLYRSTHKTFEQYCADRFSYHRRQPYHLIEAAVVVDNLREKCAPMVRMPTSERQVRPMTKLEPEEQHEVWLLAIEAAGNKVPSGRIVKDVVERIMERTKVPNPHRILEVCQILPKDNPELRGKSKCWCIVSEVNNFSCTVRAWDGEYVVKMNHLKSLDYSDDNCQQMHELCDRITKLRNKGNLEEAALNVLEQLGEIKRPYLTPLEEELLFLLENKYGIG